MGDRAYHVAKNGNACNSRGNKKLNVSNSHLVNFEETGLGGSPPPTPAFKQLHWDSPPTPLSPSLLHRDSLSASASRRETTVCREKAINISHPGLCFSASRGRKRVWLLIPPAKDTVVDSRKGFLLQKKSKSALKLQKILQFFFKLENSCFFSPAPRSYTQRRRHKGC